nr:GDP-mannose 4,6-dehydratase [Pseudopedobacter sp.]
MGKKVLITGGSGTVGANLSKLLLKKGYQVAHLSRSSKV